jgi:hypothetical protein
LLDLGRAGLAPPRSTAAGVLSHRREGSARVNVIEVWVKAAADVGTRLRDRTAEVWKRDGASSTTRWLSPSKGVFIDA